MEHRRTLERARRRAQKARIKQRPLYAELDQSVDLIYKADQIVLDVIRVLQRAYSNPLQEVLPELENIRKRGNGLPQQGRAVLDVVEKMKEIGKRPLPKRSISNGSKRTR